MNQTLVYFSEEFVSFRRSASSRYNLESKSKEIIPKPNLTEIIDYKIEYPAKEMKEKCIKNKYLIEFQWRSQLNRLYPIFVQIFSWASFH